MQDVNEINEDEIPDKENRFSSYNFQAEVNLMGCHWGRPMWRTINTLGWCNLVSVRSWFKDRHNNITLYCILHPIIPSSLEQKLLSTALVSWDSYSEVLWIAVSCLNTDLTCSFSLLQWELVSGSGSNESTAVKTLAFHGWKSWGKLRCDLNKRNLDIHSRSLSNKKIHTFHIRSTYCFYNCS